eukprot:TRINITY_DN13466_c0_g1_i1.p1 TRINITY_DN13466_c0_g1~~TRINITY_DN13466_c0_g1_i1.p1  ORF type:complete len:144 (+),score=25.01 TRINITY_DN13466_c0_g1_i1:36-467(+)
MSKPQQEFDAPLEFQDIYFEGGDDMPTTRSRSHTTIGLIDALRMQNAHKGKALAANQKALHDLKREIAVSSKMNFALEKDVRSLDTKIALLIRNRITVEEIMASSRSSIELLNRTTTLQNKDELQVNFYTGNSFICCMEKQNI